MLPLKLFTGYGLKSRLVYACNDSSLDIPVIPAGDVCDASIFREVFIKGEVNCLSLLLSCFQLY